MALRNGVPTISWNSGVDAQAIYRNGVTFGDWLNNFPGQQLNLGTSPYQDREAGIVAGRYHYSVEWQTGQRVYCGVVDSEGATSASCSLASPRNGFGVSVRIDGLDVERMPGRPVLFRNGVRINPR